jgi:capsular polysaccharide biosynthesis protein
MLKLPRTKHIKICDDISKYNENYCHFLSEIITTIFYYAEKNNLKKNEIILYNSFSKYQDILSLFCISRPLEKAPPEVEVLTQRADVGFILPFFSRFSAITDGQCLRKIIYVVRDENDPNRTITNDLECLNALIHEFKDYEVVPVRFEHMSFRSQIDCVKDCKLLVGAHGAGMTNCLFMQPGSCLVEIFPSSFIMYFYRNICINKKIHYDYFHGMSIVDPGMKVEEFIEKQRTNFKQERINLRHMLRDVNFSVDVDCLINKCKGILKD